MMKAGLIKRQSGKYRLTPFGKVIYCCTTIAKKALDNYYNLKAIEATEVSGLPNEEIGKLIDVLIDNQQVKEFLTKKCQFSLKSLAVFKYLQFAYTLP